MIKNLISILLVLSISFANFSVALVYAQETETSPEVTESPAPAIIETGDANSNVTIENEVNTNVVTETPEEAAEETPAEEETTTEEPVILPEEEVVTEETTEDPEMVSRRKLKTKALPMSRTPELRPPRLEKILPTTTKLPRLFLLGTQTLRWT